MQAKIIKLLTKNSAVLISHIDTVENVANEELATTGARLGQFQNKLDNLKCRISEVENELKGVQGSRNSRAQNRLRRAVESVDKSDAATKEGKSPEAAEAPLAKMHRAASEITEMLSKTSKDRRLQQVADRLSKRDGCGSKGNQAQQVWVEGKRALVDQMKEQLKDDTEGVADGLAAIDSVRKCVQGAVAAGLEARQQVSHN